MSEDWKCHKCGKEGYKTDGECKIWCRGCLGMHVHPPATRSILKHNRNEPCHCGSGIKYKKCCINK